MLEIDRIQKKKEDRREKARIEEERKKKKEIRRKRSLRKLLDIRRVEQNKEPKNAQSYDEILQLKDGEYEKSTCKKKGVSDIHIWEIEDEEESVAEEIKIWIDENRKILRYFFNNYSSYELTRKKLGNASLTQSYLETISLIEIARMFKDHNIPIKLLSKIEISSLIRQINLKYFQNNDSSAISFEGFIELFVQVALFIYNKPPAHLKHLPPVALVQRLMQEFKNAAKKLGERSPLFSNPHATSLEDPEVLIQLTKIVESNNDFHLPESYKKIEEKHIQKNYTIGNQFQIKESVKICTELVDDLLKELLGSHIIEPTSEYFISTRVVSVASKEFRQDSVHHNSSQSLLKGSRNSSMEASQHHINERKRVQYPVKMQKVKNLKITPAMKLEIACAPSEDKEIIEEVADVLADIVSAVEKGRNNITSGSPINNKYRQNKAEKQIQLEELKKANEEKRRIRAEKLKQKVEEIKILKERKEMEKKQQQ